MRQKMLENLDDSVKGQKPKVSVNFGVVPGPAVINLFPCSTKLSTKFIGSAEAHWSSALLGTERPRVGASPASLPCGP